MTRRVIPALVLLFSLTAANTSQAAGDTFPSRWSEKADHAAVRLDRTATLLSTERLGDAVRAGAALVGVHVDSGRALAAPTPEGVPDQIAQPVGELLAAARLAGDRAAASLSMSPQAFERLDARIDRLRLRSATESLGATDADSSQTLRSLESQELRSVDRSSLFSAGLLVADTIDRVLPKLRAFAATQPMLDVDAANCDLVNATPALCIGNTGDNTYTQDEGLLIDLGGNEVYRNSAGGAFVLGNQTEASINIDVAGNDRYEAQEPMASGAASVQGSANYGIGMLVDAAGDDSYASVATSATFSTGAHAQGYAAAGVGMLADLAGSDSYLVSGSVTGKQTQASAEGQGYGGLGLGAALDFGGGNDTHIMDASSCWSCLSLTYGFGYGRVGGAAISHDDGGSDTFSMRAGSVPVSPEDPDSIYPIYLSGVAAGMGYGDDGGAGVQITGPGDTKRTALAETASSHTGGAETLGLGFGDSSASFGGLLDQGGNDQYSMASSSYASDTRAVDDGCGCPGVKAEAIGGSTHTAGMGTAALGGAAILRDLSGDDEYVATASSLAEAAARDDRSSLAAIDKGARASASTRDALVEAEGTGIGGLGVLDDAGGNDSYDAQATSKAQADATALLADASTAASAVSGSVWSAGQGAGVLGLGVFRDGGGNDTYDTTNLAVAEANPPTEITKGTANSYVQAMMLGGGPGNALLLETGGDVDSFASIPAARTPCNGTRGGATWADCGPGAAVGVNPV
jgi:hypothetical protein